MSKMSESTRLSAPLVDSHERDQQAKGRVKYGAVAGDERRVQVFYTSAHEPVRQIRSTDAMSWSATQLDRKRSDLTSSVGPMRYRAHCHDHEVHDSSHEDSVQRRLLFASILCLLFMVAEIVGGVLSNSLAIATDAAHLLVDFASFMISLFSLWIARRPASKKLSFGWYRAEVIGALLSVLLIWMVTGILVYMAAQRIVTKTYEVDARIMLITAGLGVLVNIIMGVSLQVGGVPHGHAHSDHDHSHGHGNGHGHGDEGHHGHESNINIRSALVHIIGDFLQSLGVLVAALVIYFRPEWAIADPICTFLFSIIVLCTTFSIIKDVLRVLMEGIPKNIDFQEVYNTLMEINGVVRAHNLRIWSLTMDKTALSVHLVIRKSENSNEILDRASRVIYSKLKVFELTIQVEEYRDQMESCVKCVQPAEPV